MGLDLNLLADDYIDDQFLCHICCGILQNPKCLVKCGHTFCRVCIEEWMKVKNRCPIFQCSHCDELIIGNVSDEFLEEYQQIRVRCKYCAMGCNQLIGIENMLSHESNCKFSKDNYHQCQCGQIVNHNDTEHKCLEYLKIQIQNLKSSQSRLEIIQKDLVRKLKERDEECRRLSQLVVDCQLTRRADPLNKRSNSLTIGHKISEDLMDIIEILKELSIITSAEVERTMISVDRKVFCPHNPYNNYKTGLGFGAEFNSPVTDALILEALRSRLVVGARILHIGCGTGYLSACMAVMCANQCHIIAIDHIPQLVELAHTNVTTVFRSDCSCIKFFEADGRQILSESGSYDVILVEASVEEVDRSLLDALRPGGRLCAPVGDAYGTQSLLVVDKSSDGIVNSEHCVCKVWFNPLTDRDIQLKFNHKNED